MTAVQQELWRRIAAFSFDGKVPAALSFQKRLARENRWSNPFADRAVEEYKRFAFLAVAAGHSVCPSEQVDQVWHLHLTYTRSYWDHFCKEALGRPLHHDRTRGGAAEASKHNRMYEATLASYRRLFNDEPPADIWPAATIRFGEDVHHRQVNTQKNWIIPKVPFKRSAALALLLALSVVVTGCIGPVIADAQADRELYLLLYVVALVGAFAVAAIIRRSFRQPEEPGEIKADDLDLYDYALLSGGPIRVLDTCLVRLTELGAIRFNGTDKFFMAGPLDHQADPIERQVYDLIAYGEGSGRLIEAIRKELKTNTLDLDARKERLIEMGLLLNNTRARLASFLPFSLIAITDLALALPRIITGVENHKPSCFLLVLMVGGFIAAVIFSRQVRRTLRGDRFYESCRANFGTTSAPSAKLGPNLILGTALLGTAALAATPYDLMAKALHPRNDPTTSGGGCGSGCGGGCGGGGGGCGGGCGGGGD